MGYKTVTYVFLWNFKLFESTAEMLQAIEVDKFSTTSFEISVSKRFNWFYLVTLKILVHIFISKGASH